MTRWISCKAVIKLTVLTVTVALLYVHQQIQLVNHSYYLSEKKVQYAGLLDQKKENMCMVASLGSAKRMMTTLREHADEFEIQRRTQVVTIASKKPEGIMLAADLPRENFFARLLQPKRTAYAQDRSTEI